LQNDDERFLFYLSFILYALKENSYFFTFVPTNILDSFFKKKSGKFNLIQSAVMSIVDKKGEVPEEMVEIIEMLSYDNVKKFLLFDRFDIETKSTTTVCGKNRAEAFRYTVPDDVEAFDIQVIGPFEKASGLGQATRLSADIFEKAGYGVHRVNFDKDNPAPEGYSRVNDVSQLPKKAKINIIHLNAEALPDAIAYMPDVFTDAYNIGYFYWELSTPAKCHSLGIDIVDEIWVSTDYGIRQYQPVADKPVTNVHMAYGEEEQESNEESRVFLMDSYGFADDDFIFLTTFDSFSFIQRKNPIGVLRAFQAAFPVEESVKLIVKTHNRYRVQDPIQLKIWEAIDAIIDMDDRIVLVNETFSYEDLLKFKKGADCYISLHRSEGWGFGMIEAMNLGLPIIATAYSGNMEFCNQENSWLVEYDEVYLSEDDYIFVIPGQKWAEPRIESAVEAMREAYQDDILRDNKVKNAKAYIEKNFSVDAVADRYRKRIDEIMESID
ncbi:MAG: hypothetical protein DRG30_09225, partial [Epsilonproteobacteria bacterium]